MTGKTSSITKDQTGWLQWNFCTLKYQLRNVGIVAKMLKFVYNIGSWDEVMTICWRPVALGL